jgi:hypothetical protein
VRRTASVVRAGASVGFAGNRSIPSGAAHLRRHQKIGFVLHDPDNWTVGGIFHLILALCESADRAVSARSGARLVAVEADELGRGATGPLPPCARNEPNLLSSSDHSHPRATQSEEAAAGVGKALGNAQWYRPSCRKPSRGPAVPVYEHLLLSGLGSLRVRSGLRRSKRRHWPTGHGGGGLPGRRC